MVLSQAPKRLQHNLRQRMCGNCIFHDEFTLLYFHDECTGLCSMLAKLRHLKLLGPKMQSNNIAGSLYGHMVTLLAIFKAYN